MLPAVALDHVGIAASTAEGHVAFQVAEPLLAVLEGLRAAGLEPIGGVEPCSDGRPSLFLHPSTTGGVLVELVEGPRRS